MSAKRSTSEFFDSYAVDFSALYGNTNRFPSSLLNHLFRRSMRLRFERTLVECRPIDGATILDIGCGPGLYSVAMAQRGAGHITGIDFAPKMIQLARKRADAAGCSEKCEFVLADFMDYPEDRSFDYCVAMGFMDYVADPVTILRKILALTCRRAVISFPSSAGILARQRRWRYRRKCPLYMYSASDLDRLLTGCGAGGFTVDRLGRDFFVALYPADAE